MFKIIKNKIEKKDNFATRTKTIQILPLPRHSQLAAIVVAPVKYKQLKNHLKGRVDHSHLLKRQVDQF